MKIIYALAIAATVISCAPAKLAVSDDLKAANDEYTVKGRQGILINQKLSFGNYQTTKVKRSWTKGTSSRTGIGWGSPAQQDWVNLISVEYINRRQTVNFSMSDGRLGAEVFCVSRFNATDLQLGRENSLLNIGIDLSGRGGASQSTYYVQVFTGGDDRPWQLLFDNQASQAKARTYIGYLAKSDKEFYTIHPVTKLEHKGKSGNILFGAAGFEIRNAKGQTVAAVSEMDRGTVWLAKTSAEERFLMANVCAALLLQQEIAG